MLVEGRYGYNSGGERYKQIAPGPMSTTKESVMVDAVRVHHFGGQEVLTFEDVDLPPPGPGEARVRHTAIGVNFTDVYYRTGLYPAQTPFIAGNEAAGVVEAVGEGVSGLRPGTRVAYTAALGGYAAARNVAADRLVPLPPGIDDVTAAGMMLKGLTAWYLLRRTFKVGAGHTVLVHAAAGGVGTIAVQLARDLGARVIGTASESNHDYLRGLGATPTTYGPGLLDRVRALAPEGVDAALDLVGGQAITTSLALVQNRDRIGTTVDRRAVEEHGVRRVGGRSLPALREIVGKAAAGRLALPVRTFPLRAAVAAHHLVEGGHVRGKVAISVP